MADTPKMTPEEATEKLRNLEWSSKNYAQIRQYLKAGADANVQKEDGRSLLFVVCIHLDNESEKLVKELLQAGADPNIKNERGDSSVYAMALMSNPKKLKALAQYGADFLNYEELLLKKFKRDPEAIAFIKETIQKQKEAKRDVSKAFGKIGEDNFTTALCMGPWNHKQR